MARIPKTKRAPSTNAGSPADPHALPSSSPTPRQAALESLTRQFGVPAVDLAQVSVPPNANRMIPADFGRRHLVLAVNAGDGWTIVAMANPDDQTAQHELSALLGHPYEIVVTFRDDLERWYEANV